MKTIIFSSIPAVPKQDIILHRLGYKKNVTTLNKDQYEATQKSIELGLSLCNLKGVMGISNITYKCEDFIEIEGGTKLYSRDLSKLLSNSQEVLLMAATAGRNIVDRISYEVKNGDASLGVILDSVASQAADASVAWIMDFGKNMLLREGKYITKHRYSPGFRDFSLSHQKIIFKLLDLQRIGLSLTEKYMFVPEKSVIAIAGIEV